jgi:hypothetical protein
MIKEEDQSTRNESVLSIHGFILQILQRLHIQPRLATRPSSLDTDLPSLEPPTKRRRLASSPAPSPAPRPGQGLPPSSHSPPPPSGQEPPPSSHPPLRWAAQVPLGTRQSCADLTATARRFASELLELEFEERRNNRLLRTRLRSEDVRLLVPFLFSDVFGHGGRERIYALIDELSTHGEEAQPPTSGAQAADRAADPTLLPAVRAFFSTYSQWHQGEVEHARVYPMILQSLRSYQLYVAFARLRTIASGPDGGELRDFLAGQGFHQSRGVDVRTCILRYLCRELGMSAGQLNNALQAQLGIYHFVKEFGPGILVLLPKVASYR